MKTHLRTWMALSLGLLALPSARGADNIEDILRLQMEQMVREQFRVTQDALQAELSVSQTRLRVIESERNAALSRAKAAADQDAKGLVLLKKYDALIAARYVDKKGVYQGGFQLVQTDVDAINDLMKSYVRAAPLADKVSAGQARRTLTWAIDRTEDLHTSHASPTETNNSDLEILAKMTKDEELRSKKVLELAASLSLTMDPNRPPPAAPRVIAKAPPPETTGRKPANVMSPSKTSKKKKAKKTAHE